MSSSHFDRAKAHKRNHKHQDHQHQQEQEQEQELKIANMTEDTRLPPTEALPPVEQDRLFKKLTKGTVHSTQVVPKYEEFRLGHGDPLMKATMKHDLEALHPRKSLEKSTDHDVEKTTHLIQRLSPISGMGMNDIVHLSKDEVISVPCLPDLEAEKETRHELSPAARKLKAAMIAVEWARNLKKNAENPIPSPQGFNDIVHLPDGSIISMPMLPFHHSSLASD